MQFPQINKPIKLNLDKSRKSLKADEAFYLLNNDPVTRPGKQIPYGANFPACDMVKPAGENYTPNSFYSGLTKENYSWVYNHNGVHYLQRINSDGVCEVVYVGCLRLNALPKHDITQFRAFMKIDKLCANQAGRQLIWTNGEGPLYQMDVEASIATNYFTTPFFQRCADDPCDFITMCVPDPCDCLKGEFIPPTPDDIGKTNNLVDTGYKFAYRHIYYDERASIWSDPSTLFFQDSTGCFDNPDGFSRCIKLRIPVGNPLVDRIQLAFWKNGIWYLADTIEKYKKYTNAQQFWYERDLSETVINNNFSETDCAFDYTFCDDKQCDSIDITDFNRVFNPIPRDVQALMPVGLAGQDRSALGAVNYITGNCPIDRKEIEKLDINLDCTQQKSCPTELVTVTVRAVIHNRTHDRNQFIYRLGGSDSTSPDDTSDTAYFGGLNPSLDGGFEIGYDQFFNDKTRNFIVYIEGTDFWKEMEQWKAHAFFTVLEKWQVIGNMDDVNTRNRWRRATRNGEFFYQEAKIKVPKGTRGFLRLASHHATGNEQNTSTFVIGIMGDIRGYKGDSGTSDINSLTDFNTEEIYFDTCNGDVTLNQCFLIEDNAVDTGVGSKASAYNGYIKDKNGVPIEGAFMSNGGARMCITDHNGFYHFYINPGDDNAVDIDILVERNCFDFVNIQTVSMQSGKGANQRLDVQIEDPDNWTDTFYANVLMKVLDCSGSPVSGIRVALSGSKYKSTGPDGNAHFKIRNYIDRNRRVQAVVLNNRGCISMDCSDNCSPCLPTNSSATMACYNSLPTITLPDVTINISNVNRKGLKSGGRYPFGVYARWDCGKISAVYNVKYLDVPRMQDSGNYNFCDLVYFDNGAVFPDGVKCISIVRGANVNPFTLQWIVDKVERTSDNKIKLTIQTLNDYNAKYFFKTNTVYQWLKDDRVEFIRNGDGNIFLSSTHGLLNYQALSPFNDEQVSGVTNDANFFNQLIINDDGKLDDLTEGAVIELQRPKECTTEPIYFSICVNIPVVNGRLQYPSGRFHTFDTYLVNRSIGTFPPQAFEHHSPSDFWGDHFDDTGRDYFVNKFENERRFGRNISINSPNIYNRFGDLVKTFNQTLHGDIIAVGLRDDKVGLCISEHNNSRFEVGSDLLQVGGDGIVRAMAADSVISDPQAKLYGDYGCRYDDIGSIYFGDGYVTWVDVSRHCYVKHNYHYAKSMDIQKVQSYFRRRCDEIQSWNKRQTDPLNMIRFSTGLNYDSQVLFLTIKALRDSAFNNEPAPYMKRNETLSVEPNIEEFLGFVSFTGEAYGRIEGIDCAMLTYFNGIPYIHPVNPTKYNEFFGVACDWYVGASLNDGPKKIKEAISIEMQSDDTFFFAKSVTTDKKGYLSEIPAASVTRDGQKWNASFKGNINSRDGLFGDERPMGYEINILFCRDNTDNLKYNSIDNNKRTAYSELDLILFKARAYEQAGFEQNL